MTMLPVSQLAAHAWANTDGSGATETAPQMSPRQYDARVQSAFGAVASAAAVRSFEVAGVPVTMHTDGRRPSPQTVRVVRATWRVLTRLYGPCPHPEITVFLADGRAPKALPVTPTPVTVRHVNSGFSHGATVVVFRASEMHRTVVHELLHAWRTHSPDRPQQQLYAHAKLGAPRTVLLTESFVEAVTYLVHGGFCQAGLRHEGALRVARAYLRARDDGRTNGWAYFVGRALLVADGGARFHGAFFDAHLVGRKLIDADAHRALVRIMAAACAELGGPGLPLAPEPGTSTPLCLCHCSLGAPFA